MNKIIFLFFCLKSFILFAQDKASLNGIVTIDNVITSDAIIELKINNLSKYSISDKKGIYKFDNITVGDSVVLKFNYLGFKTFIKKLKINNLENEIPISITEVESENLKEVIIKGKENIIISAKKSSYKINSKDFIVNAKAPEVLSTIPNVFVNGDNGIITIDGTLTAVIFIDGLDASPSDLKTLDAKNIDRIEVINNPSSSYGSEFTGAIINIITKKQSQDFIKGSFTVNETVRLNNWFVEPSISYKRKWLTFKFEYEYKRNNQDIDYTLNREIPNNNFFQFNRNESKGFQKSLESRASIKFSKKSNLNLAYFNNGYTFKKNALGFFKSNNENQINFINNGENGTNEWNIATNYNYLIKENKNFYFKSRYLKYNDFNNGSFVYQNNNPNVLYNLESVNNEFSSEASYLAEEFLFLKKKTAFNGGLKYINRNFEFSNTLYFVNQNIYNLFTELETEWNSKFSSDISLILENTTNKNSINLNQKYNFILPTLNFAYKFKNNISSRFGYSRRILRPSATDLNDALYFVNPTLARQGNKDLEPQIRNYYTIMFNKIYKSNNFSLKFYNESINNSIVDTYKTENELLIQTLQNAAKYNSVGMSLGIRTKLFKKINTNLNSGFDYNSFEDNSPLAVIRKNFGYTYRGNLSLSTNLFKNKLSVSFSGTQNGPNYTLLSKNIFNPYLDFRLATNILKNKVSISLYARNISGTASNIDFLSDFTNFKQNIGIRNNTQNIALTVVYNFGKIFDDTIDDNGIDNSDIRK